MNRILVVEDDQTFRGVMKKILESKGYTVDVAADGKEAQGILGLEDYDLLISDIRMPQMNGIELLHWVKRSKPIPVLLMTGFSEISETQEAVELGADGFIPKPFKKEDLLKQIAEIGQRVGKPESLTPAAPSPRAPAAAASEGSQAAAAEMPAPRDQLEFCKVPIEDFVAGATIPYNIFLRLKSGEFIKIAYKGEDVSMDRIKGYREKDVTHLWLKQEDFSEYVGLNLKVAKALRSAPGISKEKKQNLLKHTGEVILERLFVHDLAQDEFRDAREYVSSSLQLISEHDDMFNLLSILNDHGDALYAHSVGVSMYSMLIAKKIGWHSSPTLFKVFLAGLLHDIGMKELPRELVDKPRHAMSASEKTAYESHTIRGGEILNSLTSIPSEVALVVMQHHEDCAGFGYPRSLTKAKIFPLARLISVADIFCEYAIKGSQSHGMDAKEAIETMMQFNLDRVDQEFFNGLLKLFKLQNKGGKLVKLP